LIRIISDFLDIIVRYFYLVKHAKMLILNYLRL